MPHPLARCGNARPLDNVLAAARVCDRTHADHNAQRQQEGYSPGRDAGGLTAEEGGPPVLARAARSSSCTTRRTAASDGDGTSDAEEDAVARPSAGTPASTVSPSSPMMLSR